MSKVATQLPTPEQMSLVASRPAGLRFEPPGNPDVPAAVEVRMAWATYLIEMPPGTA